MSITFVRYMSMGSGTIDEWRVILWALARFQFSFRPSDLHHFERISLYKVVVNPCVLILLATAIELHGQQHGSGISSRVKSLLSYTNPFSTWHIRILF